jgi:hypothetical protein
MRDPLILAESPDDCKQIAARFNCGGSNSANKCVFKHDLQAVANAVGTSVEPGVQNGVRHLCRIGP